MMRPWEIIEQLGNTTKRLEKERILSNVPEDGEFWIGAWYAYDPFTMFHIKKLPVIEQDGPGTRWPTFEKLVIALSERAITGNIARDTVAEFANACTMEQWNNWYKRILSKDLKCGVAVNLINKMAPEHRKIKTFDCQLATDMAKATKIPTDAFIEAKYDGTRALWTIHKDHETRCFSRNGKEYNNFGKIAEAMDRIKTMPGFPDEGLMIDSEVISDDFQSLMKQARRKKDVDFHGVAIVFDIMPLDQFWDRSCEAILETRRDVLENVVSYLKDVQPDTPVELSYVEKGINAVTDDDKIMELFEAQLVAGFEGIMIKDAKSTYDFKRNMSWLKLKPTETFDLKVVDLVEGEAGSKYEGMLGAFVVEGEVDGKFVKSNVGSGIDDVTRHDIWQNPELAMEMIVEIKADAITIAESSDHYSLRFPRFIRFREDKS